MIRINLLGGERQVKKKTFVFDSGRQTMVASRGADRVDGVDCFAVGVL